MSSLQERMSLSEEKAAAVKAAGLSAGDFVRYRSCDVWYKVSHVYSDSKSFSTHGRGYSFPEWTTEIHHAADPWDFMEVRYIADENGEFGTKRNPPVPDKYRYQGPLELIAWAWKYRKYAYHPEPYADGKPTFKNPVREAQLRALNLQDFTPESLTNLNWSQAADLSAKLEATKNKDGWSPCVSFKPLEVYKKSISVRCNL